MRVAFCLRWPAALALVCTAIFRAGDAGADLKGYCARPEPGSRIVAPADLRSHDGALSVDLTFRDQKQAGGATRYCYTLADGTQSPTLRLHPGDLLRLRLRNGLTGVDATAAPTSHDQVMRNAGAAGDPCDRGAMTALSTNLHFHGLTVPPVCHQDEVLRTSIQPGDAPFEYTFRIPDNEPPGLYWYHPHIHGFSSRQVQGGASGALVIEGIERAIPDVAGLPERVLVVRDQGLQNPTASPSKSEPVTPRYLVDSDGDAANTKTGYGKPAKDLSINFVPVPYPDYPPATLMVRPGERELWRVLNASAITYLHLAVLAEGTAQELGVVAIDGVPINIRGADARPVAWVDHIGIPPGGRAEFIATTPAAGKRTQLITRSVDTGKDGENDPNRPLADIIAAADAPEAPSRLPTSRTPLPPPALPWLGDVTPARVRKLYFSERPADPAKAAASGQATEFYLTVDGQAPAPFDPMSGEPNIVVRNGEVEDWIIENHSRELHAFHIHQLHFLLLEWFGMPVHEPFLRDTVNVPYFDLQMNAYPSVRLRMDFRDPNLVGTFVYHCHLLEHEDGGMMGIIRVDPAGGAKPASTATSLRRGAGMRLPMCSAARTAAGTAGLHN